MGVPIAQVSSLEAKRRRAIWMIGLGSVPVWLAVAYLQFTTYETPAAGWALVAGAGLSALMPLVRRLSGRDTVALHWLGAVVIGAIGAMSWFRGGFFIAMLQYTILYPLLVYVLRYRRLAKVWIPVFLVAFVALFLGERAGLAPPRVEPTPAATLLNMMGMLLVVATVGYRAILDLDQRDTEVRALERNAARSRRLEALSRLSGGLAHDFNNLLAAITSRTESLVLELRGADLSTEDADAILDSARRGVEVTQRLLAFSREDGSVVRRAAPYRVLARARETLHTMLPPSIELSVQDRSERAIVGIDERTLTLALLELSLGAGDAMDGQGEIRLSLGRVAFDEALPQPRHGTLRTGPYVVLGVHDSGATGDRGEHLFEPFFEPRSLKAGAGLSLASVLGTVIDSGGAIDVVSRQDEGTTVNLYLPVVSTRQAVSSPPLAAPLTPSGLSVLLVEDEASVRRAVARLLKRSGYHVESAFSAETAVALCGRREEPFDVLLTDVMMPGMSGVELAEALRGRWPALGVVFISGYADVDDLPMRPADFPRSTFLRKPVDGVELVQALESSIVRREGDEDAAKAPA